MFRESLRKSWRIWRNVRTSMVAMRHIATGVWSFCRNLRILPVDNYKCVTESCRICHSGTIVWESLLKSCRNCHSGTDVWESLRKVYGKAGAFDAMLQNRGGNVAAMWRNCLGKFTEKLAQLSHFGTYPQGRWQIATKATIRRLKFDNYPSFAIFHPLFPISVTFDAM